jgi:RHS repeat-associated protein
VDVLLSRYFAPFSSFRFDHFRQPIQKLSKSAFAAAAGALLVFSTIGSVTAATLLDGDGVAGWKATLPGTNNVSYHESPYAACVVQYNAWKAAWYSIRDFGGIEPSANWWSYGCNWTGRPNSAAVRFFCNFGYERRAPGTCVRTADQTPARPSQACGKGGNEGPKNPTAGNPIEILSGRKFEQATDFTTADSLLHVRRSYFSLRGESDLLPDGVLRNGGVGWTFDFGPTLRFGSFVSAPNQTIAIYFPDGPSYRLKRNTTTGVFHAINATDSASLDRWSVSIVGAPPVDWTTLNTQSADWIVVDRFTGTTYTVRSMALPGSTVFNWGHPIRIERRGGYAWDLTYGPERELTAIVDSFGRQLDFAWKTGFGSTGTYKILVESISLPDGTFLKYSYDSIYAEGQLSVATWWDRLAQVEHLADLSGSGPANQMNKTVYHYEDDRFSHLLTGITDARGERVATWSYDSRGRATSSSHGAGVDDFSFAYTEPSTSVRIRTVTNPLGREAVYTFNRSGDDWLLQGIAGQVSANCPSSNSTYTHANKMIATITDEEGRVTKYVRNSAGLPLNITEAFGTADERTQTLTWRSDRQLDLLVTPGLTTDYAYDAEGLLTSVTETDTTGHGVPYATNGQTRTWTQTYTSEGLIASVDGPLAGNGDTVGYTYDANGYLATVTNELGHVTEITSVDALGRPLAIEDPNGIVTELSYSPTGYLEAIAVDPSGADVVTSIGYDEIGQVISVTREDGTAFTYVYDEARRLTSITDSDGNKVEFTRNDLGNIIHREILDGSSNVLFAQGATFDELGRLLTSVGVNNATWEYAYDKVSNLVSETDPRSGVKTFAYNSLNELIQTVDQASNAVALTRNSQGDVDTYSDPRLIDTTFVYNGWGEIIQESSPDIGTVVYERNALGFFSKRTDARGVVAEYAYDDAGRLTSVSYPASPSENVAYSYDDTIGGNLGLGRLTGFTDPAGETTRTHNSIGQIATDTLEILGAIATTSYDYDDAGNLQHITYPSGRIVSYWRNAEGQISSVSTRKTSGDPLEDVASNIDWLPFGSELRSLVFDNGLSLWRTYDANYRPDQLALFDGSTAVLQHYHGYQDDLNLTNLWDNLNPANDQSYWYSANNMLQNADGPWGENLFYQDGSGNLTWHINDNGTTTTTDQLTYSGTSNRIGSVIRNSSTLRSFTHDAAGNIATDVQGGVTTAYTYNNADRLASFTKGGTQVGAYVYNALGQLVIRTVTNAVPSGVTVYFYDQQGHVIAEFDGVTAQLKREYIWLGDMPIAVIDPGTPSTSYYVHADHLNRPIAMTDASKAFVAKATWLPFGGLHSYTGTEGIDLRFPGQLFQAESGLHYNWFRQYDPTTGRYTQPDPMGLVDGPNRYAYVGNDPLQKFDSTGLLAGSQSGPISTPSSSIFPGGSSRDENTQCVAVQLHDCVFAYKLCTMSGTKVTHCAQALARCNVDGLPTIFAPGIAGESTYIPGGGYD